MQDSVLGARLRNEGPDYILNCARCTETGTYFSPVKMTDSNVDVFCNHA
jgi:hypothetical protein